MIEDLIRQAARESWESDRRQWAAAGQPQPSWDNLPSDAKAFHMARAAIPVRVALMSSDAEIERLKAALKDIGDCDVQGAVGLAVLKTKARAALSGDKHE
jgi:hypothetical protein